jgi:hypothetical protein
MGKRPDAAEGGGVFEIEDLKVTKVAATVGLLGASVSQRPSAGPQFSQARPGW